MMDTEGNTRFKEKYYKVVFKEKIENNKQCSISVMGRCESGSIRKDRLQQVRQ